MKTLEDDQYSSLCEYYDSIVIDSEEMKDYITNSPKEEQIKLYKYVCRRASELKDDASKEMVPFYWLASVELEQTEGVKQYLNGEITEQHLAEYEAKKQAEIDAIVELLEQRRKAKTPLGKLKKMFSPTNSIKRKK